MTKTPIIALFLVVTFCSCTSPSSQGPSVDFTKLIPLAVGNSWQFSVNYYDTLGNVTHSSKDTLTVTGDTLLGLSNWAKPVNGRYLFFGSAGLLNTDSGVVVRVMVPSSQSGPLTRYRYPVHNGDSYGYPEILTRSPDVYLVDTLAFLTVINVDTAVVVPAGTFRCIQYRWAALADHWYPKNFFVDYFLSPGYGWIRVESYDRGFLARSIKATNIHFSQ